MSNRDARLTGPPEPVVVDEDLGVTEIIKPTGEPQSTGDPLRRIVLGTYECSKCGNRTLDGECRANGTLKPPKYCEICERKTKWIHVGGISEAFAQVVLRSSRMWRPPSTVDSREFDHLWEDVREFICDHWDANEPEIYDGLTAYALSTWLRENLTFVPHLMLMGKTTGGKTRLLNTLARVSYRAVVTASATPASMYRLIASYDVTYYISEYHGLEFDTRRELDAVVRAGQKRGEVVTRAEASPTGYEPEVFDPFSHIAIATQFRPDDDIVNRCIQVRSQSANRDMPATLDEGRGLDLRNRLLYARFRLLDSEEWTSAEEAAYGYLKEHRISGRTREKLLSLLTVAIVWGNLTPQFSEFIKRVVRQDRQAAADSEDAFVVEAIRDLAFEAIPDVTLGDVEDPFAAVEIPIRDVAERYEAMTGDEKSPTWVGQVRERLGLEKAKKRDGTVISDPRLGPKLQRLCSELNLEWEKLAAFKDIEELDEEERGRSNCSECGEVTLLTHRHVENGHMMCLSCADSYNLSLG